jgi:hypothetical protein
MATFKENDVVVVQLVDVGRVHCLGQILSVEKDTFQVKIIENGAEALSLPADRIVSIAFANGEDVVHYADLDKPTKCVRQEERAGLFGRWTPSADLGAAPD